MATQPSLQRGQVEGVPGKSGPSAKYLQERIHFLRKILLTEFENILGVALPRRSEEGGEEDPEAPSLVAIAEGQLMVDTASNQMIRAIEEFMVLTRTMKELWLFGELNTLATDQTEEEKAKVKEMEEDEEFVVRGMQEWLQKNADKLHNSNSDSQQVGEAEERDEDEDEDLLGD